MFDWPLLLGGSVLLLVGFHFSLQRSWRSGFRRGYLAGVRDAQQQIAAALNHALRKEPPG